MGKVQKRYNAKYILTDAITACFAWICFFLYRKNYEDPQFWQHYTSIFHDVMFYVGVLLIPAFWMCAYLLSGYYRQRLHVSYTKELSHTFKVTAVGVLIIFFSAVLDDIILNYKVYYHYLLVLFSIHFTCTFLARFYLTREQKIKIRKREIGWNTLIVGSNQQAVSLHKEMTDKHNYAGHLFVGYVALDENVADMMTQLPKLGLLSDVENIITTYDIDEVIIAIEPSEHHAIGRILAGMVACKVIIKITPDADALILGTAKTGSLFGTPLITIANELMPLWQQVIKRLIDIAFVVVASIILLPVWIYVIVGVKRSSQGPLFYFQRRVGLHGRPFLIYKFRSMYVNAEKEGQPLLSSDHDPRVTPFGRIMRKYRLDELPQFYNVLKGNMSLVGPRPERDYYIQQIVKKAPQYRLLFRVKPGITSWGEIKYGYAENVDEMIARMEFDLLYMDNISLATDFKILAHTILVIFRGEGK